MADIDLLACLGILHQAGVSLLVLEIVDSRDAARRARECGIAGDILDPAVVDPNLPGLLEAFQNCAPVRAGMAFSFLPALVSGPSGMAAESGDDHLNFIYARL